MRRTGLQIVMHLDQNVSWENQSRCVVYDDNTYDNPCTSLRESCTVGYGSERSSGDAAKNPFLVAGSSIEQCGGMKTHWSRHDSVGEVKEFGVESAKAKLSEFPVIRNSSLERNGTLVNFGCWGDCNLNQQSRSLL